jgi:hypothetical protein
MKISGGLLIVLTLVGVAAILPWGVRADNNSDTLTFTVDVAQDLGSYVQNNVNPATGSDVFTRGDTGICDGTIYPGGTLPSGRANNDPNAPGGIGKYRWVGTWTTNIAEFNKAVQRIPGAAPQLATANEEFYFSDSANSIITGGEWPNAFFTLFRPVLGGTGNFRYVVGETKEINIGENRTGACNLRVTFTLRKAKPENGH